MSLSYLQALTEQWVADRDLPSEHISYLEATHNDTCQSFWDHPLTAPGHICSELDLPQGSSWPEVTASLLDACLNPMKQTHLNEVRQHIAPFGEEDGE